MAKFRFSVSENVTISYFVELGTDYSLNTLLVQGRNTVDEVWLDTNLIQAVAEGTGIRLTIDSTNATPALPNYYRVTANATEVLSGTIYVAQSDPLAGAAFSNNVKAIVQDTVTAGDNATVSVLNGKVIVSANLGLSAKIWDDSLGQYVEGTIWIGPIDPAAADPNLGYHAWIDSAQLSA